MECNGDCSEDWNYAACGEYFSKKGRADPQRNGFEDKRAIDFYNFMDVPVFHTRGFVYPQKGVLCIH